MGEHFDICSKKGRGMAQRSLDLIDAMYTAAETEPVAWERCEIINHAEQESLKTILAKWGAP